MTKLGFDFDDFEFDDPPLIANPKKRKNLIGLDDLFNDHKKEQAKNKKKKSKVAKPLRLDESDDEDADATEAKLTETFHNFQQTINEVDGQGSALVEDHKRNVNLSWGLEVFRSQRTPSELEVPELVDSFLLQPSLNNEFSVLMDHSSEMGEAFLSGLLLNGWLPKLIINRGYLEESVAKWTLNLLFFSLDEPLMTAACDFWCAILLYNKVDVPVVKIEWLPGSVELKGALESFGFQAPTNTMPGVNTSECVEHNHNGSACKGPPANIRAWMKFVSALCQVRHKYLVFSTLEVQELVEIVVCLFLERQLLGLTVALHDCLLSAINFFEEKEWSSSCEEVSKSVADRVPRDLNCVRAVECISGVDSRSQQLRSAIASQILRSCFAEVTDAKDILKYMLSKNLKEKSCDLFKIYIYFVLTENWLLFGTEADPTVNKLWVGIIRKCSSQISNTDFRPCAQEIRNRASYLLQCTSNK